MMSLPAFTAEAALYKTSGHYRSGRNTIKQMTGTMSPALARDEEIINVTSCGPGQLQLGEGENMVCINPNDPFGTGGNGGPADTGPGGGDGPGSGGNGGTKGQGQDPKYANRHCSCHKCAPGGGDVDGKCKSVCQNKDVFTGGEGLYCTKSGQKDPPIIPPVGTTRGRAIGL